MLSGLGLQLLYYYIIVGYIIVVLITFFTPPEIVGLAYDSGGVTTSTVTVPLVTALGIGLASSIKGRNPVIDGFGLIAFASLTPMIFVQIYGIIVYTFLGDISATNEILQITHLIGLEMGLFPLGESKAKEVSAGKINDFILRDMECYQNLQRKTL